MDLPLIGVVQQTENVKSYRFDISGYDLHYRPGQFANITANVPPEISHTPVTRPFTISSSPTQPFLELTIKVNPEGVLSKYLFENARPGQRYRIRAPYGVFCYEDGIAPRLGLIGGGAGITPMMSIARYLTHKNLPVEATLIFSVRAVKDIIFREELEELGRQNPRLKIYVVVSDPGDANWAGLTGRVSKEIFQQYLIPSNPECVFLCGPPPMMDSVLELLPAAGYDPTRIKTEKFTPAKTVVKKDPEQRDQAQGEFAVHFVRSDKKVVVKADQTVLDVALIEGVDLDSSCRAGACGTCKVRCLKGTIDQEEASSLDEAERQAGYVLVCVGRPQGDLIIDERPDEPIPPEMRRQLEAEGAKLPPQTAQEERSRAFAGKIEREADTLASPGVHLGFSVIPLEEMRTISIFQGLNERTLARIQPHVSLLRFEPKDIIVREGDYGESAYFVRQGRVEVFLRSLSPQALGRADIQSGSVWRSFLHLIKPKVQETPSAFNVTPEAFKPIKLTDMPVDLKPEERAFLEEEEIFGEAAALSRYPRSATVIADTPCELVEIRVQGLRTLMSKSPAFKRFVEDRYRERMLEGQLRSIPLFQECDQEFIDDFIRSAELRAYEPSQIVARQGDPADAFYIVRSGFIKISARAGQGELTFTYLTKGEYFGEISLLRNEPKAATLTSVDYVEVVKIPREKFQALVERYPQVAEGIQRTAAARLEATISLVEQTSKAYHLEKGIDRGFINGRNILLIDLEKCVRCDDCVRACAANHGGNPRFVREGTKVGKFLVASSCMHCTDPVCMVGCPTGAIHRNQLGGEVVVNEFTCIGCQNCVRRCPYGNILPVEKPGPEGKNVVKASKCDLCIGSSTGPACVYNCPVDAAFRTDFRSLESLLIAKGAKGTPA